MFSAMISATLRAFGQSAPGRPLEVLELPDPRPLGETEVEIRVEHCSVRHSDVHLLDGDWGEVARPLVPGHEVVGHVVRAGSQAKISEGALVGLGWQAGACGACGACRSEREHLCSGGKVRTCMGRPGGFADRVRCDARFCFELPTELDRTTAAPLLCAGLTVFSPLERLGVRAGSRIGVVGVGGLGHLAVRFASALGASVIAFDPDRSKKELALSLGAADLVDARGPLPRGVVDLLLVTTHATLDWNAWMGCPRSRRHPLPRRNTRRAADAVGRSAARRAEAYHRQRDREREDDAPDARIRGRASDRADRRADADVVGERSDHPRARGPRADADRARSLGLTLRSKVRRCRSRGEAASGSTLRWSVWCGSLLTSCTRGSPRSVASGPERSGLVVQRTSSDFTTQPVRHAMFLDGVHHDGAGREALEPSRPHVIVQPKP